MTHYIAFNGTHSTYKRTLLINGPWKGQKHGSNREPAIYVTTGNGNYPDTQAGYCWLALGKEDALDLITALTFAYKATFEDESLRPDHDSPVEIKVLSRDESRIY